jgi:magnesium transporter
MAFNPADLERPGVAASRTSRRAANAWRRRRDGAATELTEAPASANAGQEPGVIAATAYVRGQRVSDIKIEEAGEWAKRPEHVVWIGLFEPSDALLRQIQQQLNLHPLAIEDAGKAHQYPKLERYGEGLFIVARTAQIVDGHIAFGETHIFVGNGYVVTVRHGASKSYKEVRERTESCPTVLSRGENYIVYALLDFIVDNYGPVLEVIHAKVETIEADVLKHELHQSDVESLYSLRRDLLRLRNAIGPLMEVCQRLEHAEAMPIESEMRPLFRDVTDHVRRVKEEIDALREVLAFAFEASLMAGQAQQTAITRKLAAWAAILAVPTAVAGIYGMNFDYMPELQWQYGYFLVVGAILLVCGLLFVRFRQNGWL